MRTWHDPQFQIHPHLVAFMQRHAFYASISRQVRKRCTRDIPTAAVSYDVRSEEIVLWYNDLFMKSLSAAKNHGVLKHEFGHIVFRHLTARRRKPGGLWNVACDMAIDWLVWKEAEQEANLRPGESLDPECYPLPLFVKTPGKFPWVFSAETYTERAPLACEHAHRAIALVTSSSGERVGDMAATESVFSDREPTADEKRAYAFSKAIEDAPGNMSSEWYFNYLSDLFPPCESGTASGAGTPADSMDGHDVWDDVTDADRERIENAIRAVLERAVREADTQSNGWGSMPADLIADIRRSVSTNVDWRSLLASFIGTVNRGSHRRSVRVRDRKYGLSQPGVTTGYAANLVVVIDQSGSVTDEMLAKFFAELEACTRKITVTILPFDAACNVEDAWVWQKGQRPELRRTLGGGTDFDAPTNVINEHAQAKGWEGAIFMTDGDCCKPGPCFVKRAWIIGEGRPIPEWIDGETAISMDDNMPSQGAWR